MRIGVIGAMEEEVEMLRERMNLIEEVVIAGCEFHLGGLEGVEVILSKSGIGKVNAAISATLMNQLYHPDYIINTGSAGGLNPELEVGDVVVSTEVRYNDVDATVFGYEFGQVPRMPAFYTPDQTLIDKAVESADTAGVGTAQGLVLSGDSFMSDAERVESLKAVVSFPYCAEMEAGAIAHVCHQFQCPFVVIRSLSDIAGKGAKISYDTFLEAASVNSAHIVLYMLEELRKEA